MYEEAAGEVAAISQTDVDQFKYGIEPLVKSEKLGALLAQFPPSFKNDKHGQQILLAVIRTFGAYQLAVELRHRSWSDDMDFPQLLRDNNISWVQIDEPKFRSSVAAEVPLTSDMGYFRFHGRNAETWWSGDNETRYKYLYSPEEIEELAEKVETAGAQAKLTFAFFNNHWQAYAPRNAVDIKRALKLPFQEIIMPLREKRDERDNTYK
jgi:uncharacterized protein YecE (DUF72 family)